MGRLIALATTVCLTSCSFVATSGPRNVGNPPRAYPACTNTMTWPIVDAVVGGLMLAAALSTGLNDDSSTGSGGDESGAIVATALIGAAFGVGAYVGYTRVSKCRVSREQYQAAYPGSMQPYGYQPYQQPQQYPPAPQPQPQPPQPPQPQPPVQPKPPVQPPLPTALGTEGDVCAANNECATGLTCSNNVCVRPPARAPGR